MQGNNTEQDLKAEVRNKICDIIDAMRRANRNKLPTEVELAKELQVSRVTVRSVLADLVSEGKVLRRQGSGTYINPTANGRRASLYHMLYYWDIIMNCGYRPSIRLIETNVITAGSVGKKLGIKSDSRVLCMKRAFCADGKVCIYCIDYIDESLVEGKKIRPEKECSVFQLLYETTGRIVTWADVHITVTDTRRMPELAPLMNDYPDISKPLLVMKDICYDKKDVPVLYTESFFDTDIIEFSYIQQYGSGRTTDNPV